MNSRRIATITLLISFLMLSGCSPEIIEANKQAETLKQLEQLAYGNLQFESYHAEFPYSRTETQIRSRNDSRLSWRVQILKFLGGDMKNLHFEFRHDEPWDSDHNSKLIDKMPEIFKCNHHALPTGETLFAYPSLAPGIWKKENNFSPFAIPNRSTGLRSITDGTQSTIMLVEVNPDNAITWTKPMDWEFVQAEPYRSIDKCWPDSVLVAFASGSTGTISRSKTPPDVFEAMISRSSGDSPVKISK